MKTYYVRFGRKFSIPPTIQIKNELRRMMLADRELPAIAPASKPDNTMQEH